MLPAVADLRARPYSAPLTRPFITARRRVDTMLGVLVEIELADGTVGHGSAGQSLGVTGESVDSVLAVLNGPVKQALTERAGTGRREVAAGIAGSCVGNFAAKAAADVALHDAWARTLGVPLAEALGGDTATVLRTDMTVSLDTPQRMADAAVEAVGDGFDVLKIKLGNDWRADLDRLRAVREAAPDVRFRLDANQGWDVKSAIRVIRAIEDAGIPLELVEQPVASRDLAGMAAVTAAVDVPVMADESVSSPHSALEIVQRRAADLLNIKLAKCGGIDEALAIADIARAAGIECMVGAMMEPRISIAAAAHLAAAHPAVTLVDLDSAEWIDDPDLSGGYTLRGSEMHLHPGPGIGFAPWVKGEQE
ncbi:L-alanine-DL-glutamate epimerase-like enolase superfamily enzyme [Prauserella sediminis]|uniref:Dipeptide epimerase n=1 Tax=Prauserella sediminis TaxID=577680 RepID=A0A839XKC6_9PSEU|nr:dipeptide epimerase [Prauserella sediminis]MBB3663740.1 L-alanine-DL-glutamate epimerase-like enolase superfamily enzyme [Prauserella sediminis]